MAEELNDFKGGMTENYVNVQFTINGYRTYYWESKRGAEIDFVIQREGKLIPVEVKSADNTKAKSLNVYMNTFAPLMQLKSQRKTSVLKVGRKRFLFMQCFVFNDNLCSVKTAKQITISQ